MLLLIMLNSLKICYGKVWIHILSFAFAFYFFSFLFFFFFFQAAFQWDLSNYGYCSCTVNEQQPQLFDYSSVNSALMYCSRVLQTSIFSHLFIKNESHGTIYTFKNYFTTVFSVFSFSKINYIQMDLIYLYFFKETYLLLLVSQFQSIRKLLIIYII